MDVLGARRNDQGEEYLYQRVSDDEFLLNGRIGLDDFNEILGTDLVTELADTLGGYIYGTIGRVPTGGEHMRVEDWDLMVEQVSGRRIRKVRAHRQPLLVKEDNSNEPNS